jgi:tetratricopeptide (TPR) repeat protein
MAALENAATNESFEAPVDDARESGLPPRISRQLRRARQWLDRGDVALAMRAIAETRGVAADHPESLRVRALVMHRANRYGDAIALLRRARALRPRDELILNNLGGSLAENGDFDEAIEAFRAATEVAPHLAAAWFNLANAFDRERRHAEAIEAATEAVRLDPRHRVARTLRANLLAGAGRIDDAIAEFRETLRRNPDAADAWVGLFGLKAYRPEPSDIDALRALFANPRLPDSQRALAGFALGMALDASDRLPEAFETFTRAARLKRSQLRWDAAAASRVLRQITDAFATPIASADDAELGREVIVISGLPRSGSTLAEQIVAAHPDVDGLGEIPALAETLRDEGRRRGADLPQWINEASPADWTRLGREYLDRAKATRTGRARFTDKSLINWQIVGVIRAMLPGASIVECRRAPIETTWSCFKHCFASEQLYSYDFDELAAYWRDYDRMMRFWHAREPGRIYVQSLEALTEDPEARIRDLLAHVGLPFDAACLRHHKARRHVRTLSAAQVREPIRGSRSSAERYGALLDPLRRALENAGATA